MPRVLGGVLGERAFSYGRGTIVHVPISPDSGCMTSSVEGLQQLDTREPVIQLSSGSEPRFNL